LVSAQASISRFDPEGIKQQQRRRLLMELIRKLSDRKGFSLIELLVAITVLSVGLLAVAGLQGTAMRANSAANRMSAAASLAQEVMEDVTSWGIADPRLHVTAAEVVYDLDPNTAETSIIVPGAGTYRATFSTTVNDPVAGVTRIVVTVNDLAPQGAAGSVSLTGYQRVI
jgi:type IV pilus assembly protein PilV